MKNFRRYLLGLTLSLLFVVATGVAFADVGNFRDYGSRSSWSSSGSSRSFSESDIWFWLMCLIVYACFHGADNIWRAGRPKDVTATRTDYLADPPERGKIPNNTAEIAHAIQQIDTAFSAGTFLDRAKEIFITLHTAWTERDWEKIRPLEAESLYKIHAMQLKEYVREKRINVIERVNIDQAYLFMYRRNRAGETLSVYFNARMVDYIKSETTGKVLQGSPDTECFIQYLYIFRRQSGEKTTTSSDGPRKIACPHCGAPTKVIGSGKCEYCGFVVTVSPHTWVLSDIVGVRPNSNYGAGGVFIE